MEEKRDTCIIFTALAIFLFSLSRFNDVSFVVRHPSPVARRPSPASIGFQSGPCSRERARDNVPISEQTRITKECYERGKEWERERVCVQGEKRLEIRRQTLAKNE